MFTLERNQFRLLKSRFFTDKKLIAKCCDMSLWAICLIDFIFENCHIIFEGGKLRSDNGTSRNIKKILRSISRNSDVLVTQMMWSTFVTNKTFRTIVYIFCFNKLQQIFALEQISNFSDVY